MAFGVGRKGRMTADDERKIMALLDKGLDYLLRNFNQFDKRDRINIALELVKRRMPQKVEHKGEVLIHLAERIKEARSRVDEFYKSENK